MTVGEIYTQLSGKGLLPSPIRIKKAPDRRNLGKWCEYHKDHGHTTDECRVLKSEIEKLIQRGCLTEYVDKGRPPYNKRQDGSVKSEPSQPEARQPQRISTISGGSGGGGDTNNSRRTYARRSIYAIQTLPPRSDPITFSDTDLQGIELPHDDPLVIAPTIGNYVVERVLVDTGSSADILFASTFDKLGLSRNLLRPVRTSLTGFTGHSIEPLGAIHLDVTMGTHPKCVTVRVLFTVVNIEDQSYNALLGRGTLNTLRAVVSPIHLMLRFPTPGGIGEVKGDQKRARVCYAASAKTPVPAITGGPPQERKRSREPQQVAMCTTTESDNAPREKEDKSRATPHEEVEKVPFKESDMSKTFQIGSKLTIEHKVGLIRLIREFQDVFAWNSSDMPGVDPEVALHKLYVDPAYKPVKQKKRNFNEEKSQAIRKEVGKLIEAGGSCNLPTG